jgi:hypothetical protein
VDFRPHYKLGEILPGQDFLRKFSKSCGNLEKFIPTIRGRENFRFDRTSWRKLSPLYRGNRFNQAKCVEQKSFVSIPMETKPGFPPMVEGFPNQKRRNERWETYLKP